MFRVWFRSRRSLLLTFASGGVVAALVAAVAIISTGYTAQKVELQDASVWVSNSAQVAVGRANTEVLELNSVISEVGADVDIVQSGAAVLVVDYSKNTMGIVDAATSTTGEPVALPPDDPQVLLAGNTAVILARATGEVWFVPLATLAEFDAQSAPTLNLGTSLVASVDSEGVLFAYSPTAGQIYRMAPDSSDDVLSADSLVLPSNAIAAITAVGETWAVLDSATSVLYLPDRQVQLELPGATATGGGGAILQQASVEGDAVLVADSAGLVAVTIDTGEQQSLVSGQSGAAAAPVVVSGCAYAAWSGGNAWRQCAGSTADTQSVSTTADVLLPLVSMSASSMPVLRFNGTRVVLNDAAGGSSWAVQSTGELINNWDDLIPPDDTVEQEVLDDDTSAETEDAQQAPVAVADELGVRPGRTSTLPVLVNDYDANGDVLTITDIAAIDETVGVIDRINNNQQLQITLSAEAAGTINFQYSISDGRGGTAEAAVVLTVRAATENSAPEQVRSTMLAVAAGARASTEVLGDWIDPDGDAFYLASGSTNAPNAVSVTPDGTAVFSAADSSPSTASVTVSVSDGSAVGTGSMAVTVQPSGDVPLVADPFIVLATSGTAVTVAPLDHVHGGGGDIRLVSVPSTADITLTPAYDAGTFQFSSDSVGTHYVEYVVTDGDLSITGVVRVDVAAPAPTSRPITVPKTVFVQSLQTAQVDVAGTDIDPGGGVLVVTGISNLVANAGVSAEILDQRYVRVRLDAPLQAQVSFNYSISNGLAEASGSITVIEIPVPAVLQPPIATDDSVTVRVGASLDIAVLANDQHPDGETLALVPSLAEELPDDAGLLFASSNVLRYLAPDTPGNFVAVYEVEGPDGQRARAQVKISVREADTDTNTAPVPTELTARVLAGSTVTISVPLSGIDTDGDTVQLLGQESSPEKGSVVAVGADSITYRAGDYSTGTDTFEYAVIDALGARATGTVRVGISARLDGARNPVATIDEVATRPGTNVSVQVLANDSDPDGSALSVVSAVPNDDITLARVEGDLVVITPPDDAGVYGVVYTIENELGGTSSNFVRVSVDPDAPLSSPVVTDTVLTLSDIIDHTEVNVDVLARVFFADGDPSTLELSVYPGFEATARVTAAGEIRITPIDTSQIIPFKVTHPDDPEVFSYGFIRVPGFSDALPQLDASAPELSVVSGEALVFDLNDYVLAAEGLSVQLTDTSSVRATHSNGDTLVVDRDTLVFTSADQYFGTASISFEVTDGTSASDPSGRTATLVLPITVLPKENQAPVFDGAVLEIEPAEVREIDLTRLTTYPYPDDVDQLVFSILSAPDDLTTQLDGQSLTITAAVGTPSGSSTALVIGVSDAATSGQAGRIEVTVVPSTRPLARAATDTATVRRGQSTTVDVLANDAATNPFPGTALRVVAIRGTDSSSLPAGVQVTPSADNATLTVTVADSAAPTDTTLQYQIMDATGDDSRTVWGTVRISVQDRPDPVSNVRVTEFGDRSLTVAFTSAGFNNSAITGYRVLLTDATSGATVSSTVCAGAQCSVATRGNGADNAVRISVVALNAIGESDPASSTGETWSDIVPAAPTAVAATPLDNGLRLTWRKPASAEGGSPISRYVLGVAGLSDVVVSVLESDPIGTVYTRDITDPTLGNGSTVRFTVSARNDASADLAVWNSAVATGTPAGAPQIALTPAASVDLDNADRVVLSWSGAFTANGRAVSDYYAAVFTGQAPACTVEGGLPGEASVPAESDSFQHVGTTTATSFSGLKANTTYRFVVYAFNGMGCTASAVLEITPRQRPGTVSELTVSDPVPNGSSTWDMRVDDFTISSGSTDATTLIYRLSGGSVERGEHGPVSLGSFLVSGNGSHYGQELSVQAKACVVYPEYSTPVCSAYWSTSQQIGVPVSNDDLTALNARVDAFTDDVAATGTYSWTAAPSGAYTSVTVSCGATSTTLIDGAAGQCTAAGVIDAAGAVSYPGLRITITVDGTQYVREYAWNDYD